MLIALLPRVVCALVALSTTAAPRVRTDSSGTDASVAIADEMRAYYRDLHARDWNAIVTHFYPAKVTARFAVPDTRAEWMALEAPASEASTPASGHDFCAPRIAIVVLGKWARVRGRRCSGELDEAWFYVMSGKWKIIHLESGQPLTT